MAGQAEFTEREQQIIALLLEGKSNKQTALALHMSVRTVEFHLGHIYAKLGVSSRVEAALKLSEMSLRESATGPLRDSTVVSAGESQDNTGRPIPNRRIPMKALAYALAGALATTLIIWLVLSNSAVAGMNGSTPPISAITIPTATASPTPDSAVSAKEHVLEQIRQSVAEYDRAVQAEKKDGQVTFSKDPVTGEDIFLFKGDSFVRMMLLEDQLWQRINQLNTLYVQIYRDETRPTPFPAAAATQDWETDYEQLLAGSDAWCVPVGRLQNGQRPTVFVYHVDDGKYHAVGIGDEYARCEVYSQMVEEWRTAPLLARVNHDSDMALIRRILGRPDLVLNFQSIGDNGNDASRNDAVYVDDTGTQYYIDIETGRLASIQSNFPGHPSVPAVEAKTPDQLRALAREFAIANSPHLLKLEPSLQYEEGSKGEGAEAIYFFTWRYTTRDWSGTDWAMMPPFIQIGMLTNGQIVTYFDTLDLFEDVPK